MSEQEENKFIQIIRNCLSEKEKKEVLSAFEKYEKDSENEQNKALNGEATVLIPIVSVSFGWVCQLALCKCNQHQH